MKAVERFARSEQVERFEQVERIGRSTLNVPKFAIIHRTFNEAQLAPKSQSCPILPRFFHYHFERTKHYRVIMLEQTILTCALLASSRTASAVSVDNRTLGEIYQAAQHENGVLNVYFGGSCKPNDPGCPYFEY